MEKNEQTSISHDTPSKHFKLQFKIKGAIEPNARTHTHKNVHMVHTVHMIPTDRPAGGSFVGSTPVGRTVAARMGGVALLNREDRILGKIKSCKPPKERGGVLHELITLPVGGLGRTDFSRDRGDPRLSLRHQVVRSR